ncbi:MAG: class I SAM-dependent methyltransferase, partial [Verrucomicrobiota bacterium]
MQPTEQLNSLAPPPDSETTAWRIFHDAEAGVWVDHFDGRWLVQTGANRFPEFLRGLAKEVATSIYWRPRDKAASTAPARVWGEEVKERFLVKENGASFWIDFDSGYSSGIFLDQRLNRRRVGEGVLPGQRILNTFAYTGGFSVMAARSGAITTTADLSKTYLNWTWDNFSANGLDPDSHFGVKGDAIEWMQAFARKGRTFHGIVLDPPTFSRNKKSTFSTDSDYADLAGLAASLVEPGGWILCCAN